MMRRGIAVLALAVSLIVAGIGVPSSAMASGKGVKSYGCVLNPNKPVCKKHAAAVTTAGSVQSVPGAGGGSAAAVTNLPATGGAVPEPANGASALLGSAGLIILGALLRRREHSSGK